MRAALLVAVFLCLAAPASAQDSAGINVWLHTSHPTMPNLIIEPDRVADLIAYIGSLKKKPN